MKEHFVIDPLISKRQQLLLATQLCRMVLKVCIKSPSSLDFLSALVMTGKRGSDARVVRAQVCGMARYTRQALLCFICCNTDILFVTQPRPGMPWSNSRLAVFYMPFTFSY
jgi:hypothetical protein